jgi:cytosine/adenosine deaminase-related metal-dependent hydrolase
LLNSIIANRSTAPITIHHDETASERELIEKGTGELAGFLKIIFEKDFAVKEGVTSVESLLERLKDEQTLLLVHNTYTTAETVQHISQSGKNVFWCFCPKANLYIENRLPDLNLFQGMDNCCIGTDSLASNESLHILEEIKTILRGFPSFTTEQLLKWATFNGAKALMMDGQLGSLEPGKKPGIILIENTNGKNLTSESRVKRLF